MGTHETADGALRRIRTERRVYPLLNEPSIRPRDLLAVDALRIREGREPSALARAVQSVLQVADRRETNRLYRRAVEAGDEDLPEAAPRGPLEVDLPAVRFDRNVTAVEEPNAGRSRGGSFALPTPTSSPAPTRAPGPSTGALAGPGVLGMPDTTPQGASLSNLTRGIAGGLQTIGGAIAEPMVQGARDLRAGVEGAVQVARNPNPLRPETRAAAQQSRLVGQGLEEISRPARSTLLGGVPGLGAINDIEGVPRRSPMEFLSGRANLEGVVRRLTAGQVGLAELGLDERELPRIANELIEALSPLNATGVIAGPALGASIRAAAAGRTGASARALNLLAGVVEPIYSGGRAQGLVRELLGDVAGQEAYARSEGAPVPVRFAAAAVGASLAGYSPEITSGVARALTGIDPAMVRAGLGIGEIGRPRTRAYADYGPELGRLGPDGNPVQGGLPGFADDVPTLRPENALDETQGALFDVGPAARPVRPLEGQTNMLDVPGVDPAAAPARYQPRTAEEARSMAEGLRENVRAGVATPQEAARLSELEALERELRSAGQLTDTAAPPATWSQPWPTEAPHPQTGYAAPRTSVTLADGTPLRLDPYGDAVPGGYNGGFRAFDASGNEIGVIEYQSATGTDPLISWVRVEPGHPGVSDALLQRLQAEFPTQRLDPGMLTDDGARWWQRVEPRLEEYRARLAAPRVGGGAIDIEDIQRRIPQVTEINPQDVTVRPDLFQLRDVPAGQSVDPRRVAQIASNFEPGRLDPIDIARDVNTGELVVFSGHHRLVATQQLGLERIPARIVDVDFDDPVALRTVRNEAIIRNQATAPLGIREKVNAYADLTESGMSVREVADAMRTTPGEVETLLDVGRVGPAAIERVNANPRLRDAAAQVGRGVRLYNIDPETAMALFTRFTTPDDNGALPGIRAIQRTIDAAAPQLAQAQLSGFSDSALLRAVDEAARLRAQIQREVTRLQTNVKGAQAAAEAGVEGIDVDRVIASSERILRDLQDRLDAVEVEIVNAADGFPSAAAVPTFDDAPVRTPDTVSPDALTPDTVPVAGEPTLPRGLSGAKPRYADRVLSFESDVDRALYIVANPTTRSASHDAYVEFLRSAGLSDADIAARGRALRGAVATAADGTARGEVVTVPRSTPNAPPAPAASATPAGWGAFPRLDDSAPVPRFEDGTPMQTGVDMFGETVTPATRLEAPEAVLDVDTLARTEGRELALALEETYEEIATGQRPAPLLGRREPDPLPSSAGATQAPLSSDLGPPPGMPPGTRSRLAFRENEPDITELLIPGEHVGDELVRVHTGRLQAFGDRVLADLEERNEIIRRVMVDADEVYEVGGRLVVPDDSSPEWRQLRSALHNPSAVEAGEIVVPERLRPVYEAARELTDWETAATLDFDPEFASNADYFYRGWRRVELTAEEARAATGAKLGGRPGFAKERVDATYDELVGRVFHRDDGTAYRLEPLSWNPFEQASLRTLAGQQYREQARLINWLVAKDVAIPVDGPIRKGYRVPELGPAFEGRSFPTADGGRGNIGRYQVPDRIADTLESMYGAPGELRIIGSVDVLRVLESATSKVKQAKLYGSLFQQVDFTTRSGASSFGAAIYDLTHGRPVDAVRDIITIPHDVYRLLEANLSSSRRADIRAQIRSADPILAVDPADPRTAELTWELVRRSGWQTSDITLQARDLRASVEELGKRVGAEDGAVRHVVRSVNRAMQDGLFDGVYPQAQMITLRKQTIPRLLAQHPTWTAEQIAGEAARLVNLQYSSLPVWQSFFKNKNGRALMRQLFFSANERESLIRQAFGAVSGRNAGYWRETYAGAAVMLALTANAVHLAATGEPMPLDRYSPVKRDPFSPLGVGYNNSFLRPDVPFIDARNGLPMRLDLMGQLDTVFRTLDPVAFLGSGLNVFPRAIMNQVKGEDFYGRPLEGFVERAAQAAVDVGASIGGTSALGALREGVPGLRDLVPENEGRLGVGGQLLQTTGANTSAYTNEEIRDLAARRWWESLPPEQRGDRQVNGYNDLEPAERKLAIDATRGTDQDIAAELELRRETAAERQDENAQRAILHDEINAERIAGEARLGDRIATRELTGRDVREEYGRLQEAAVLERAGVDRAMPQADQPRPTDPLKAALWDYYDVYQRAGEQSLGGDERFDFIDAEQSRIASEWTPEQRAYVERNTGLSEHHEAMQDLIDVRAGLESGGFWQVDEDMWAALQSEGKAAEFGLAGYNSYYEWRDAQVQALRLEAEEAGYGRGVTADRASEIINAHPVAKAWTKARAYGRARWMAEASPALIDDAVFYGYLNPTPEQSQYLQTLLGAPAVPTAAPVEPTSPIRRRTATPGEPQPSRRRTPIDSTPALVTP